MANVALTVLLRLVAAVPVLVGATFAAFLLGVAAPGDPALHVLAQKGIHNPPPEQIEAVREAWGLNRPLVDQYTDWLSHFVRGDMGVSIVTGKSISAELARTLPVTLTLSVLALAFALFTGIASGLVAGYLKDTWIDQASRFGALVFLSIPGFWLAIVLISIFSEHLRWLPTSGWVDWIDVILPTIVLGAGTAAVMSRMTRAYTISNLVEPYVLAARGRGLPESVIAGDFVLRNMLVPLIGLAGTYLGGILSGTVIVEYIFAIPGAGRFAYESVLRRDYTAIQSYVALVSLAYIAIGIATDLVIYFVDPRIRFEGRA